MNCTPDSFQSSPAATLRAYSFFLIAYRLLRGSTSSVGNLLGGVVNSPLVLAKGSVGKYSLKRNGDRVPKATSNWDEDRNGWMMVMEAIRSKPAKAGHPPWGVIPILTVRAEAMPKFIWQVLNGAIVSDGQHVGYIFPHLGMKPPGSMNGG